MAFTGPRAKGTSSREGSPGGREKPGMSYRPPPKSHPMGSQRGCGGSAHLLPWPPQPPMRRVVGGGSRACTPGYYWQVHTCLQSWLQGETSLLRSPSSVTILFPRRHRLHTVVRTHSPAPLSSGSLLLWSLADWAQGGCQGRSNAGASIPNGHQFILDFKMVGA